MKNGSPFISVILPVYNADDFIEESVKSILNQTYRNFELLLFDDGSTDKVKEIIQKIGDERIRYYHQPNCGMAEKLNRGIDLAQGDLIARQDADDISFPQRFEKQVDFLTKHPDVGLLGTWSEIIPVKNNIRRFHKHAPDNAQLQVDLLFDNPFVHTSVMMRKEALKTVGYYDTTKETLVQDYDFWSRFSRITKLANLPEVLVYYREINSSLSRITINYSRKVINQSIENISYFHAGDALAIAQVCSVYYEDYEMIDANILLGKMTSVLNDVVNKIAENTGEELHIIKLKMRNHLEKLTYRYYKNKQRLAGKNILLKFWYRIWCKARLKMQF